MISDKSNLNINVNMTGKEYTTYREKRKLKIKPIFDYIDDSPGLKIIMFMFAVIILMFMVYTWYVEPEPSKMVYTVEGVITFLAICLGLSWVFHGVGFVIIKR